MKYDIVIRGVIASPGKTCCELAALWNAKPDQLSSILNGLVKKKLIQRRSLPGQRRSVKAWRYWPIYSVEQQEKVVCALYAFARAQQKRPHNCKTADYSVNLEAVGEALAVIMETFDRGVARID